MDKYTEAAIKIIKEQESVIGPVAFDLAKRAGGINFVSERDVTIQGDPQNALNNLVVQYSQLFGRTSVEVSKKAIRYLVSSPEGFTVPDILK